MLEGPDGRPVAPPPPPPPPQKKPDFNKAVQQALAARAKAEGKPAATHGYEQATIVQPGDTLYGIATQHGDTLPADEADNAQLTNPNLLYPGQAVFSPGQDPVSAATTKLIQNAEESGSPQAWAKAQAGIEADLRAQGKNKLQPDKLVQPTVDSLNAWATGNDKLRQATANAYKTVDTEWQNEGVTSQQIAPILADRATAVQDQNALSNPKFPHNRGIVQDEQQAAAQAWSKVSQDTQHWLQSSIGLKAFPEDTAATRIKELDALYPNDPHFAAANQLALQGAKQTWSALGITHAQLDPVIKAYSAYEKAVKQRQQTLGTPYIHNLDPDAVPDANQAVATAQKRLQTAIEKNLDDAGKNAGSPQQAAQARLQQAAILRIVGPQTGTFTNAVNAANHYVQVVQPAQTVAAAYRSGGAKAGAQALVTATQNAPPGYAGAIIAASRPTIDHIASDLATTAKTISPYNTTELQQVSDIYGDLSQAVENTNHGPNAGGLSNETKNAANVVADALASRFGANNAFASQYGPYTNPALTLADAAQNAIGNRQGTSLSLALSATLRKQGQPYAANAVVEGAAQGYDELKAKTDTDVKDFAKVTANLEQLRSTWAPFMTNGQLNAATEGYARRNPGFVTQFGKTLTDVQNDGTAIFQARQAFSAYRPDLNGLQNTGDLVSAAGNLTGKDANTYFAVQESGQVTMNVAQALAGKAPPAQSDYAIGLDAPGVLRSVRTAVNQWLKSSKVQQLTGAGEPGVKTSGSLSGIGLGLTTTTVKSELQHFNQLNFAGKAVTVYNTLGFSKYLLETGSSASTLARTSGIRFLGALAQNKAGTVLSNLSKATYFKTFSSFYYLTGAFANGVSAYDAASTGDPWTAGLDSTNALGNLLLASNASKTALAGPLAELGIFGSEDAAANALDIAGPVGALVSVFAQFGLAFESAIKQKDAQKAFQSQGADFLEDGLHIKPDTAYQLADISDPNQQGPAPVLLAYAKQYGIKPQALLEFLGTKNANDVDSFVYLAELLKPGKNGQYAVSSPSDTSKLYYIPNVPYQNSVEFSAEARPPLIDSQVTPTSLRQLQYWAEAIFGSAGPNATS